MEDRGSKVLQSSRSSLFSIFDPLSSILPMPAPDEDALTDESFEDVLVPEGDSEGETDADTLHFRFKATKTQTRRIDQFLSDRMAHLSRAMVQRLIDDALVKVNGRATKASYKIKNG